MNVVIDTNVWISALISEDGAGREIIRQALLEKISPQVSATLFLEYEAVMLRESIQQRCILDKHEQAELFQAFLSTCTYNEIFYLWRPNLKDHDDNFLVELAVASNSAVIITENVKDFKSQELHFQFEAVTAQQFLERSRA